MADLDEDLEWEGPPRALPEDYKERRRELADLRHALRMAMMPPPLFFAPDPPIEFPDHLFEDTAALHPWDGYWQVDW